MKKQLLSLALALAICLSLAAPAMAAGASVPMAPPEAGTSLAQVVICPTEEDESASDFYVDYFFVIDRQGALWQYQSAPHKKDAPIAGELQKKQVAQGVVQIGQDSDGVGILKSDGSLSYLHLQDEEKIYPIASGVSRLTGTRYLTSQGQLFRYYWDSGVGRRTLTGVVQEREPGVKTELLASDIISFVDEKNYVTADHVLHYSYSDPQRKPQRQTLAGIQSVYAGYAGPARVWGGSKVYFALGVNGDLYGRGVNSCGFVGNGGKFDYTYGQTWGVHMEDLLDKTTLSTREVYQMTPILSNVEKVWASDKVYALDKDGNYWTWGDPSQPASIIIRASSEKFDRIIEAGGKTYYGEDVNLPAGKPYASPRKMKTGEAASLLPSYRQDADGTLYVKMAVLGELDTEYALPHAGGVLGGPLNFTVGSDALSSGLSDGFFDVKPGDWFYDAVQWAVGKNIAAGTSATTFSPKETCTRAQILTFLWRAAGSPEPETDGAFADVAPEDYYAKAALWAKEKGLVEGESFNGNTPCTRGEAVIYLWKLAGSPAASGGKFSDVPAGSDVAQAVAWAVEQGVTSGTSDTTFSPEQTCARGQIVTFLYRDLAE